MIRTEDLTEVADIKDEHGRQLAKRYSYLDAQGNTAYIYLTDPMRAQDIQNAKSEWEGIFQ